MLRAGYGRSYAINSGGAKFGTYCCQWPIGNNQAINSTTNYTRIFRSRKVRLLSRMYRFRATVFCPSPGQMIFGRPFEDKVTSQDAYNVNSQRQFSPSLSTEIGWVGGLGRDLFRAHEANPALPGPGALIPRKPYGAQYEIEPRASICERMRATLDLTNCRRVLKNASLRGINC